MPTSNSPDEFNSNAAQLASEVGDCPHCTALFTLPFATEPFDTIACPACEQSVSIDEISLRKVQVAQPIQNPVPSRTESLPTVADLLATATAPKKTEQKVEQEIDSTPAEEPTTPDPGHESLDDWLRRTTGVPTSAEAKPKATEADLSTTDNASKETIEIPAPASPQASPQASQPTSPLASTSSATSSDSVEEKVKSEEKKALSDTLGWNPGAFSLETPEGIEVDSTPNDSANTKKTVENIDEFVSSLRQNSRKPIAELMPELEPVAEPTTEPLAEIETSQDSPADEFQFDFKKVLLDSEEATTELPSSKDQFEESTYDSESNSIPLVESDASSARVGWGAPLSALAGLLVVGGVSYVVLMNQFLGDETTVASTNGMAIVEPVEPSVSASQASEVPSNNGIEVANFESTEPFESTQPVESMVPVNSDLSQPKSNSPESYAGDRYSQQQDRYNEPNPFAAADALPVEPLVEPNEVELSELVEIQQEEQVSFDETVAEANQQTDPTQTNEPSNQRFVGAPAYGMNELEAALDYSSPAGRAFSQGSLADPEQAQEMGKLYGDLCYLAQVVTLLNTQNMPSGLKTAELLAVDVYKKMLLDEKTSEEVNQVAGHWINWTGRPYGGIFFQGIPDDMTRAGDLYQYRFPLGDSFVYVVTEEPIDINRYIVNDAKQMGIIGIVVEEPSDRIAGYVGDAERIIWCRKTIAINNSRWAQ